ncbi:30S ribosomal protein S4 [Thiospirochaeta perfilievii]|uniref:Small ribosomal subunit protein uS4 n=1 Tax=Thiospirochaeta perfilievii TaxID=252967 RepID=A0A5C1QDB6_9SPIO|nr:30S ribosomal protein S4 [Thiospirochaeta perfilievii]QEN05407.1 30S ribosomal protein S4 [Thiospirochaeta perfilievii]
MARNSKAKGKIVRRLGVNIYGNSKYDKLLKKKPQGPGKERGARSRAKVSDFGKQQNEKQKIRFAYGMSEKQFYNSFLKAKAMPGLTGDNMMILLERRLDNVIFRLGMATTRSQARQMVSHGHIVFNGRRLNVPSAIVKEGDVISIKENDNSVKMVRENISKSGRPVPAWLSLEADTLKAKIERVPFRTDIDTIANEQVVVEFYSK